MALWLRGARNISNHFKTKIGLLGLIRLTTTSSSTSTFLGDSATAFLVPRRSISLNASKQVVDQDEIQNLDYLGGTVKFTPDLTFLPEDPEKKVQCYRVLDYDGYPVASSKMPQISKEIAMKMYDNMVTLQTMDTILYEAQRQGRICFYTTVTGEEAVNIAPAAALTMDDVLLPQYREPGVLLWRGFTIREFIDQLFENKDDYGKARQMHVHYGLKRLNILTMSAPIATQLPQAVGAAYSLKMENKNACAVTFIGDGGTSEGDFHAAMNFAAVLEAPVVFICRNNGWAISTPSSEQYRSSCVAVKGQAYGIRSIQVDGNDALAVYSAVCAAREMSIKEQRPILVEALTYRVGHHSTSDDSTKYRAVDEIEYWKNARNPVTRYRKWIERKGWWSDEEESALRSNIRAQVMKAIQAAERVDKPSLAELFTDVYDTVPSNLREQEAFVRESVRRHPMDYPSDVPLST